jgi:hypothetical protein
MAASSSEGEGDECARDADDNVANIVLVGAGWWGQGWHLPHLSRNEVVNIAAIVGE